MKHISSLVVLATLFGLLDSASSAVLPRATAASAQPPNTANLPACHSCPQANCGVNLAKGTGLEYDAENSSPPSFRHFTNYYENSTDAAAIDKGKNAQIVGTPNPIYEGCRIFGISRRAGAKGPDPNDIFFWWDNTGKQKDACVWTMADASASSVSGVWIWRKCPEAKKVDKTVG